MIPPVAVRLRRDFGAVLNLIRAHAVLHQETRQRDGHGQIVATLDDYAVVRELVGDLVAEGVKVKVPDTVRETVEAVRCAIGGSVGEVSLAALVKALKLDDSTISRRVKDALRRGFLKNLETRRGKPPKLVLGDEWLDDICVLPSVLRLAECCSVASETEGNHPPPPCQRTHRYGRGGPMNTVSELLTAFEGLGVQLGSKANRSECVIRPVFAIR